MTNPEYVLMLKDRVRPQFTELISRYNKINSGHDGQPALSMAFRLDIPSDFNPGDNIIKVITQDQKTGRYLYFADVIVTIDREGETSNIVIDVRKILTEYDPKKINEPMPKKDKSIIGKDKTTALIGVVFEAAKLLQNVEGSQVPRGTTNPMSSLGAIAGNMSKYRTYQNYQQPQQPRAYQYNPDLSGVSTSAPTSSQTQQVGQQTSLIKVNTVVDNDLEFREFVKGAPKWYRSILSESSKQKVKEYIYQVWKRTNEADDVIWQMITGEFLRKGLLTPYCQLFPERKKFIIAEDGSVHCDWTTCPYHNESGYCNHIRLRYGVNN